MSIMTNSKAMSELSVHDRLGALLRLACDVLALCMHRAGVESSKSERDDWIADQKRLAPIRRLMDEEPTVRRVRPRTD